MKIDISGIQKSKDDFRFFVNRRNKVRIANEILQKYSGDINITYNYDEDISQQAFILQEILLESMILNINTYFDILLKIVKNECNINARNNLSKTIIECFKCKGIIEKNIVEYWECEENQFIRNASNKLKHDNIISFSFLVGGNKSGCYIHPFSFNDYYSMKEYFFDDIFNISESLAKRIVSIIQLIR